MKFLINISTLLLCFFTGFSLYGSSAESSIYQEISHDAVLVILEQGQVRLETHPIHSETRDGQIIFTLDLSDINEVYSTVLCNNDTNGLIIVRSNDDTMCDYCLNWGAMFGVDILQSQQAICAPVTIKTDEHGNSRAIISCMLEGKKFDLDVVIRNSVKSVCALLLPTQLVKMMNVHQETMSLVEGCRLGVVVAKKCNENIDDPSVERELEFDRIIDSMLQDGTIKVRPVSPFMAKLRTIGTVIFIKYLATKNVVRSWWNSFLRSCDKTNAPVKHIKHVK